MTSTCPCNLPSTLSHPAVVPAALFSQFRAPEGDRRGSCEEGEVRVFIFPTSSLRSWHSLAVSALKRQDCLSPPAHSLSGPPSPGLGHGVGTLEYCALPCGFPPFSQLPKLFSNNPTRACHQFPAGSLTNAGILLTRMLWDLGRKGIWQLRASKEHSKN